MPGTPLEHHSDATELQTFVVIDTDKKSQSEMLLDESSRKVSVSCSNLKEQILDLRRYFTKEGAKEGAKEAFRYVMYPRGSPLLTEIKRNLKSGITVSLVSVPLSISLAIAGGATPVMGVVTAFWAGVVAAFVGGSHYNIVGPTGALSGVLAAGSMKYGLQVLPMFAIVAGLMCLMVWLFHLDKYIMFIPSSVIHGFTVGVAFIIGLNQLNSALGLTGLEVHESFVQNVWESLKHIPNTNVFSLVFFAVNLTALILLGRKWPKIPWAIVVASLGILVGFLTSSKYIPIELLTLEGRFGKLDFQLVSIPKFDSRILSVDVITSSVGVAFIAILETLISARIADGMTKSEHDQRREVLSVALANVLSGVVGGIPATAALARTALNIKTGATSRVSAILNAISVLLLSAVFLPFFKYIPMSSIAALLVMTSIKMVAHEHLIHMFKYDRTMFWISVLSAGVCIAVDTMVGILVGGVISLLIFTDQMSIGHTEMQLNKGKKALSRLDLAEVDREEQQKQKRLSKLKHRSASKSALIPPQSLNASHAATLPASPDGVPQTEEWGDTLVYRITGQLTYVNSLAHLHRIKKFAKQPHLKNVIISLRYLWYTDLDGVDSLEEMVRALEAHDIHVMFGGVIHEAVKNTLQKHPFYQDKLASGAVYPTYLDALNAISENDTNIPSSTLDEEEKELL